MIQSHKIKTLQLIGQSLWEDANEFGDIMNTQTPSVDDMETADIFARNILEKIALWRVNYCEHFEKNKGVKIRD